MSPRTCQWRFHRVLDFILTSNDINCFRDAETTDSLSPNIRSASPVTFSTFDLSNTPFLKSVEQTFNFYRKMLATCRVRIVTAICTAIRLSCFTVHHSIFKKRFKYSQNGWDSVQTVSNKMMLYPTTVMHRIQGPRTWVINLYVNSAMIVSSICRAVLMLVSVAVSSQVKWTFTMSRTRYQRSSQSIPAIYTRNLRQQSPTV